MVTFGNEEGGRTWRAPLVIKVFACGLAFLPSPRFLLLTFSDCAQQYTRGKKVSFVFRLAKTGRCHRTAKLF